MHREKRGYVANREALNLRGYSGESAPSVGLTIQHFFLYPLLSAVPINQ